MQYTGLSGRKNSLPNEARKIAKSENFVNRTVTLRQNKRCSEIVPGFTYTCNKLDDIFRCKVLLPCGS